ncbi:MAG: GntR family transcriptional regulator [Eubacteriales bacterium]|nr:GntR family transcriptional regulator [Eubacteriales bacterium]
MQLFNKKLDRNTPIPLYFQLKNIILEDIKNQEFSVGDLIPTENELVEFYNISRSTVRQAISELVQEGWLTRKASKGTFVTKPEQRSSFIRSFEPFYQQISRLGKTPRTELIDLSVVAPTPEIAQKLQLSEGQKVISMFRRRFADDIPMVTFENYIPYDLCSFILSYDFTTHSLYELLMTNARTQIANTKTIVSAMNASPIDVKLLNVKSSTPMLYFHNVSTTADGTVVDYAFAHYRGDLNKFEFDDSPKGEAF